MRCFTPFLFQNRKLKQQFLKALDFANLFGGGRGEDHKRKKNNFSISRDTG